MYATITERMVVASEHTRARQFLSRHTRSQKCRVRTFRSSSDRSEENMSSSPPRAASALKRLAVIGVLRSPCSRFKMSSPCPAAIMASARTRSLAVSVTYVSRNCLSLTWPHGTPSKYPCYTRLFWDARANCWDNKTAFEETGS